MASPPAPSLPMGAKGIDLGDLVLKDDGWDKRSFLLLVKRGTSLLPSGADPKVMDLHRTWIGSDGEERHEPLLQIAHTEFGPIFQR